MMIPEERNVIQKCCDAATPGPWHLEDGYYIVDAHGNEVCSLEDCTQRANGIFAVHAREDLSKALEHIAEQDQIIENLDARLAEADQEVKRLQGELNKYATGGFNGPTAEVLGCDIWGSRGVGKGSIV